MHSGSTHQFGQRCNPGHVLWHISVLSPGNAGAGIRVSDDGELLAPGSPGQKISWREAATRAFPALDINGGAGALQGSQRSSPAPWGSVDSIHFPADTPTAAPPRPVKSAW